MGLDGQLPVKHFPDYKDQSAQIKTVISAFPDRAGSAGRTHKTILVALCNFPVAEAFSINLP
jgi:hypothetical protein